MELRHNELVLADSHFLSASRRILHPSDVPPYFITVAILICQWMRIAVFCRVSDVSISVFLLSHFPVIIQDEFESNTQFEHRGEMPS